MNSAIAVARDQAEEIGWAVASLEAEAYIRSDGNGYGYGYGYGNGDGNGDGYGDGDGYGNGYGN